MTDELQCVSTVGFTEHEGPAEYVAILYRNGAPKEVIGSIEPLCVAHAVYERRWRDAMNMIALARVERITPPEESPPST